VVQVDECLQPEILLDLLPWDGDRVLWIRQSLARRGEIKFVFDRLEEVHIIDRDNGSNVASPSRHPDPCRPW